ncbi:MAG: HD domain-containing protein [Tissierellales bacterium]|nr:HD domain-containing protein [Tissierellales bacterium]MBN2827566.1 HD domain-containing protein [Tissierellales bacterium]
MKAFKTASIIYIGSTDITLRIGQRKKDKIEIIENTTLDLSIGKEAFEQGKLSSKKIDRLVEIVSKFNQLSQSYQSEVIRLIASTAMRESENKYYIRDRLYQETGLILEIFSDSELKNTIFMSATRVLQDANQLKDNAIISFIGSGNLGIAFYENEAINFLQNIMIGTLKLYEIAKNADKYTDKMDFMVREQLHTYFNFLPTFLPKSNIKEFILTGRTVEIIKRICKVRHENEIDVIEKSDFKIFYNEIVQMNTQAISFKYGMTTEFANEILIATIVIENLMSMTEAEKIIIPDMFFFDIVFYELLIPERYEQIIRIFESYAIESSKKLAEMYKAYGEHIKYVDQISAIIFEKLSKTNKFKDKESLYLKIAVILHNIGKYINPDKHYLNSGYIIKNTDIIGLSEKDKQLIAMIVKYQSYLLPTEKDEEFAELSVVEKISVSKLAAIMRIADALDKNYCQKFNNIKIKFRKGDLIIETETNTNTYIEQIKFNEYKEFFKEVFGISIELIVKRGF